MPKRAKALSDKQVKALRDEGRYPVGGEEAHGLCLRITGGSRHWVLRVVVSGVRRDMGLGAYPGVGLAEAREVARQHRKAIRGGATASPEEQRKAADAEDAALKAKGGKTFKHCAEVVIANKKETLRNPKAAAQWASTLETYV